MKPNAFVGLSKRAQKVVHTLGVSRDEFRLVPLRDIWHLRGCGLKTVQELCRWVNREVPMSFDGPVASEKRVPLTSEQRRVGSYARWLHRHGYTVIVSNKKAEGAKMSGKNELPSDALLDSMQFRNIITFLKNSKMRMSAVWLVHEVSKMGPTDCADYVEGCYVHDSLDGTTLEEFKC